MRSITSVVTSFALILSLMAPISAQADAPDSKPTHSNTAANSSLVGESYLTHKFLDFHSAGEIVIPESMAEVNVSESTAGSGLMLSGKADSLTAGRITISHVFDFDANPVGRLNIDGLGPRGADVTLDFYLDDAQDAFAAITLKKQRGSKQLAADGQTLADVLDQNITGQHTISFSISTTSTKKTDVLLRSIEFMQSSLPTIYFDIDETQGSISTMNNDPEHQAECYGNMSIVTPAGYTNVYTGQTAEANSTDSYELEYIRGRGNSTWMEDKKPYKIKLDKKTDLFGMGANKHWTLLANRHDNSQMRNKMTYWLGDKMGMEFTPQCIFVEVVMNGEYYGSYYLSEQVRVGASRVEIDDLEDNKTTKAITEGEELTGGYLLSKGEDDITRFVTSRDELFSLERPSFEDYSNDAQFSYIKDYVQRTEDAIYGTGFKNNNGQDWTDLMDLRSAVDYFLVQEVSANGDGFGSGSTYLYKKRSGKLYWGPLWDFDYVAWGDLEYSDYSYESFRHADTGWFNRLLSDPRFSSSLMQRWKTIRNLLKSAVADNGILDQYADQLAVAWTYDHEKWGSFNEDYYVDEEDGGASSSTDSNRSLAEEVDQLKGWINARVSWLEENISDIAPKTYTITVKVGNKTYKKLQVKSGQTIASVPKAPKKKKYVFVGWFSKKKGKGDKLTASTVPFKSESFYAYYVKRSSVVKAKDVFFQQKRMRCVFYEEGAEVQLKYTVMPSKTTFRDLAFSSSNNNIATVDDYGFVSFQQPGTVTITAKAVGGAKATCKVTALDTEAAEDYSAPLSMGLNKKKMTVAKGSYKKLAPVFEPKACLNENVEFYSSNKSVASITEAGVVRGKKAGTAVIFAYAPEANLVAMSTVTVKIPATAKRMKYGKIAPVKYTGKKAKPAVDIKYKKKKLKQGKDYTLRYRNNSKPGKARAIVKFKGSYTGKKTLKFKILK